MKTMIIICLMAAGTLVSGQPNLLNLMPVPQQVELSVQKFRLDSSFTISVKPAESDRVVHAIKRFSKRLAGRTGIFFGQSFYESNINRDNAALSISFNNKITLDLGMDESYTITISEQNINLHAKTDIGVLHGLETLLQLVVSDESGYYFPEGNVSDAPRFPWRGLMIDACRHFMPMEMIKRNLDGMAAVKLNVLHWHLSEDQGFRVECNTYPKLHRLGSDGLYYTQKQIREIINYADQRGIRVMPEFDLPGHATSWLVGYPELASAPGPYQIERGWGVFDPTFNPAIDSTYIFLDHFFQEMSALFPDQYMHIGGDENNGKQWNANPQIQEFMKQNNLADNHALQAYFNRKLLKILTKYHKKLVGWDEILHEDMPKNIVIQSWRGREAMVKAAEQGYQTILSNGYYIDLIQPTGFHYLNDPAPADMPLSTAERQKILGGEATMWAEMVSPETVDSRIWPRTAAIAERLWSAAEVNDVSDMYRRLEVLSLHLEELGLLHEKNYEMMLRRLAGQRDISALKALVDIIEPVKIYKRNQLRKQFSYTPLTRVVDAARPDAAVARKFRDQVQKFLSDPSAHAGVLASLRRDLEQWRTNQSSLDLIIQKSPVLKEIEPLSIALTQSAEIGLKALEYIEKGQQIDPAVYEQAKNLLEQKRQPVGQCELMILDGIEALLEKSQ